MSTLESHVVVDEDECFAQSSEARCVRSCPHRPEACGDVT